MNFLQFKLLINKIGIVYKELNFRYTIRCFNFFVFTCMYKTLAMAVNDVFFLIKIINKAIGNLKPVHFSDITND